MKGRGLGHLELLLDVLENHIYYLDGGLLCNQADLILNEVLDDCPN